MKTKVFLDSDVIISSLISPTGGASLLITQNLADFYISNYSLTELNRVCQRLSLNENKLKQTLAIINVQNIKQSLSEIKHSFHHLTTDENDTHIIAGAVASKARFLLTYNLKHYRQELIKREFNLIILTPAQFIQYLRSQQ